MLPTHVELRMQVTDIPQLAALTTPEKILFVEDIWDSIAGDPESVPVPASHVEELQRRHESLLSSEGRLLKLDELKAAKI